MININTKKTKEPLTVKGHTLGEGAPLICVPVMEKTPEAVKAEVRRLTGMKIPMIEWRVDAFERPEPERVKALIEEIAPLTKETIVVVTFRTKAQGGLAQLPADQMKKLRRAMAEARGTDFVDLEFFSVKDPGREIAAIQKRGAGVIASHHDFAKTPPSDVMAVYLEEMRDSRADVVKLAVMPQNMEDVLRLLAETLYVHRIDPYRPLITMAMGAEGSLSRAAGEYFGSCVTFASAGCESAPGQMPVDALSGILSGFHQALNPTLQETGK